MDDIEKLIKKLKPKHEYTGFTTRCRKCNEDVKSKRIGTEDGVPKYLLTCGCSNGKKEM